MNVDENSVREANHATYITLRSFADTEFTRWVDYARDFTAALDGSCLSDGERRVVMHVLNMPRC